MKSEKILFLFILFKILLSTILHKKLFTPMFDTIKICKYFFTLYQDLVQRKKINK